MRTERLLTLWLVLAAPALPAQAHQHDPAHHADRPSSEVPRSSGQAAFAAIAETVALLAADSSTDWSRVDLEALRQHLIDMDEVILRAKAAAKPIDGGVSIVVTGDGRVREAIHRIVGAHAKALDAMPAYHASARPSPRGETLVVTARNPEDRPTVTRIRALGLGGLLTEGSHHPLHHLMIARGLSPHGD
jgi:hypothetical protein